MRLPKLQTLEPSGPPTDKYGKKLFQGETFHIIPNWKEQEMMEKEIPSWDLYGNLQNFISERAGGILLSMEQASYILIRHPNINEFANSIEEKNISKRIIHFDWVMDSLCAGERLSRQSFWGIPRKIAEVRKEEGKLGNPDQDGNQVKTKQGGEQHFLFVNKLAQDPRKRVKLSAPATYTPRFPAIPTQQASFYFASGSSRNFSESIPPSLIQDKANFSVAYPVYQHHNPLFKPTPYSSNERSHMLRGGIYYIGGSVTARRAIERKIEECGGEITNFLETARTVIFSDPISCPDKDIIYRKLDRALRHGAAVLTEGWVHDCYRLGRKLAESPYKVTANDIQNSACWIRTKSGNLFKSPEEQLLIARKIIEIPSKEEVENELLRGSRVYPTPISPEAEVPTPGMKLKDEQSASSLSSVKPDLVVTMPQSSVLAVSDDINSKKAVQEARVEIQAKRLIDDDEDLDIFCTDAEDEPNDQDQDEEDQEAKNTYKDDDQDEEMEAAVLKNARKGRIIRTGTSENNNSTNENDDSEFSSDLSSESDYEKSLASATTKRSRQTKGRKSDPPAAGKKYQRQRTVVDPKEQDKYDEVIRILRNQVEAGGLPTGGTRLFVKKFGLEPTYRRYSGLIRQAVPGMDAQQLGRRPGRPKKRKSV
ncbi:uncharacterized protein L201_006988 [Kwoniella dendrophila CBS 6074]|uniref:BRCT domain-containing protein n=1 Tax=Kwoniella dendrophila CBS 6074 TaxID=1295534 RepID=A0AAX4K4H9_9TREE